jgi:hypothetical protein
MSATQSSSIHWVEAPHVVILGAGASLASCPDGDANRHSLPLMNDIIEVIGLEALFKSEGINPKALNFEALYDELATSERYQKLARKIEDQLYEYFDGLKLPDTPTIYDYLILSLRGKDLIASFNWDPLLLQAYRRNAKVAPEPQDNYLPQIRFLHGNVAIGICRKDRRVGVKGQPCSICGEFFSPSRLLYPVRHKNYSEDQFIKDEWNVLRSALEKAYCLTVFGYGVPETDIDAKQLMLNAWKTNELWNLAQVNIIDIKREEELKMNWDKFLCKEHYGIYKDIFNSYLFRYPRRSCDALWTMSMLCVPFKENRFPKFETLAKLHDWVKPLLEEEKKEIKLII